MKKCEKKCSKWLSQLKSEDNFVEEMLIVSTMQKKPCDIFHNVVSTIWIFSIVEIIMWSHQYAERMVWNFPENSKCSKEVE